ncbi:N-ethylammeline chlorohydrolase [Sulfurifustis variabilis]|uniref:5-methylthioadenosine/S-adenosylhomocysteine deaminase n=1 Tax=Sulfurifustis variabilis TaxID=1675686 RepID=A0A1B4VC29_9GAMM|nr:TRZ/ATZ family hydrolase [Sulfurifustis variabilis]BAU48631.1 N-ethylammeline chlorohydrolase [Sulfurifustis variabilis]
MTDVDTLIHARWIIPIEPAGRVHRDHALAVRGGRIVDLLPSPEAEQRYRASDTLHFPQHALLPGFVNAHTHAAMSLFRGLADDIPLMTWLNEHVWPAEAKWVTPEFVREGTELAVAEMLASGTTCFNDMYFFAEDTARVCLSAGMRAVVGLIVLDFPTAYAQTADEYLHKGLAVHDGLRAAELVTTAFAPHAPYTVSDAPLQRLRTVNDELNLPVHMHVHETAHEVANAVEATGRRPLARLAELGLIGPSLAAVHMTQLSAGEIGMLAGSGASVVHCPSSNLKLASGFCPVHALLTAGVNVAIGTDGAASNNDLDMLEELRLAALLAKGVAGEATAVPAHTALRMATLNGAKALGLDDRIGSLERGKQADLVAIDLSHLPSEPVYDPASQIVYTASRAQVSDVWVHGRRLLKNRQLTTLDERAALQKARAWRDKIKP